MEKETTASLRKICNLGVIPKESTLDFFKNASLIMAAKAPATIYLKNLFFLPVCHLENSGTQSFLNCELNSKHPILSLKRLYSIQNNSFFQLKVLEFKMGHFAFEVFCIPIILNNISNLMLYNSWLFTPCIPTGVIIYMAVHLIHGETELFFFRLQAV